MRQLCSLDALWDSSPPTAGSFDPVQVSALPEPARRYLQHSIAPGTPLASAVRLRMHGEIRLKGWYPFTAEQVIRTDGEMLWCATVRVHGLPIRGFDSLRGGRGEMEWKLLGIVPFIRASGADITRSAIGRVQGEAVWLPSLLCGSGVSWEAPDSQHAEACLPLLDERTRLAFTLGDAGELRSVAYQRWGNPDGGESHYASFGGYVQDEGTFDGYTIPTQMRIGWHFGTKRFDETGEFFRIRVDQALFR